MKLLKVTSALCALLAPALYAAEPVTAVNTAAAGSTFSILPNSYGTAEVRHYNETTVERDSKDRTTAPKLQVRGTFGSKFFNGVLDSRVIVGGINRLGNQDNTSQVAYRGTFIENDITAYELNAGDFSFGVNPYVNAKLPMGNFGTNGEVGLTLPVDYKLSTTAGTVKLLGSYDATTYFTSRPDESNQVAMVDDKGEAVTTKTDKNLPFATKDDAYRTDSVARRFKQAAYAGVEYKPNFANGLTLAMGTEYSRKHTPVMVYDRTTKKASLKKDSKSLSGHAYTVADAQSHEFVAAYALNKTWTVSNSFTIDTDKKENVYTNLVTVAAKLF